MPWRCTARFAGSVAVAVPRVVRVSRSAVGRGAAVRDVAAVGASPKAAVMPCGLLRVVRAAHRPPRRAVPEGLSVSPMRRVMVDMGRRGRAARDTAPGMGRQERLAGPTPGAVVATLRGRGAACQATAPYRRPLQPLRLRADMETPLHHLLACVWTVIRRSSLSSEPTRSGSRSLGRGSAAGRARSWDTGSARCSVFRLRRRFCQRSSGCSWRDWLPAMLSASTRTRTDQANLPPLRDRSMMFRRARRHSTTSPGPGIKQPAAEVRAGWVDVATHHTD